VTDEIHTLEVFQYRTPQGCYVYGHQRRDDGATFITMATEPPPVLRLGSQDNVGKEWRT
jgi:hypothetical protein